MWTLENGAAIEPRSGRSGGSSLVIATTGAVGGVLTRTQDRRRHLTGLNQNLEHVDRVHVDRDPAAGLRHLRQRRGQMIGNVRRVRLTDLPLCDMCLPATTPSATTAARWGSAPTTPRRTQPLALAYFSTGQLERAIDAQRAAVGIASASQTEEAARRFRERLDFYIAQRR